MSYFSFCLTYLTQCDNLRSIHVATNGIFHSFLWLSNTPRVSVRVCVCVCVCVYTHHIFFIHSSVDEHLHCFHVLAVADSAALETKVHVNTLGLQFSADISLEVELLVHIVALFFVILYFLLHCGNSRILHFLLREYILKKET